MLSTILILFVLASYRVEEGPPFADEIILSTSGCYGRCPRMNIRLKSNGDVVFYGEGFTTKNGYYKGKLPKEQFDEFLNQFQNVKVSELERRYAIDHTDDETVSITFLKNDTIVTSIKDYGRAGPAELVQIYPGLRHLYEKIELTPVTLPESDFFRPFSTVIFKKGGEQYYLLQSESFLLSGYLMSARKIEEDPNQVLEYEFEPWMILPKKNPPKITTDGRYFKITFKKSPTVVYDIGFNFLKINASFFEDRDRHRTWR